MSQALNQADVDSLNDHVARFIERSIAPLFEKPECLLPENKFTALVDQAVEQGLISEDCSEGMGLWVSADDPLQLQFSCHTLREMAAINPALAYQIHQRALSYYILRELKQADLSSNFLNGLSDNKVNLALNLQGHFGLARMSLARYLDGRSSADDISMLQDYFGQSDGESEDKYFTLHADKSWTHLLTPVLSGKTASSQEQTIQFVLYSRDELNVELKEQSHGLNELGSYYWQGPIDKTSSNSKKTKSDKRTQSKLGLEESRELMSKALQIHFLGLCNIALGSVSHGYQLAKDYAAIRVQGGCTINQHPAVRQLLAETHSAYRSALSLINDICRSAIHVSTAAYTNNTSINSHSNSLKNIVSARKQIHPILCQASNHIVQVFGGMGYMQDTGAEKGLRDCMHLRLMNGTPSELTLFLSELEMGR